MATIWEQPLDPSEQLDFEMDFTTLLEDGETIVPDDWSVAPTPSAAEAGLVVEEGDDYRAQLLENSRIVVWLSIAQAKRADRLFSGSGRRLGVIANFATSSSPARRRQREFQVKVIRQ